MSDVIKSKNKQHKTILSGFCIVVKNFYATVVPFETISCEISVDTVPWYSVILPNGEICEYNEPDLTHSKEELEVECKKLNKKMARYRKAWNADRIRVSKKSLHNERCSCGRLLGRFNGQAEIKCPKCGKINVIGVEIQ